MTKDRAFTHHVHRERTLADTTVQQVTDLLTQSKAKHLAYQQEQRLPSPNYGVAEQHVAAALDLRQQAHALDPDHESPIWDADEFRWPHQSLVAFYQHYPFIP